MKRHALDQFPPEPFGQRLAGPALLLGSLIMIALMLYAIDVTPLRGLLP